MNVCLGILALIAILVLISIPVSIWRHRQIKKKLEIVFAGRQELTEREFYEKFFESEGIPFFVVQDTRRILEGTIGADLSRLKPDDDFSKNLSFLLAADYVGVEILELIEDEFSINISDMDAENLKTVGELINLVWLKLQEREADNEQF